MKQLFIDTETGGLDSNQNALLEVGGIIRIDNDLPIYFDFHAQPFSDDIITEEALKVNNLTREEIKGFSPPHEMHSELTSLWSGYIDRYNKRDKFFVYGWNVEFDDRFLRAFFRKCGDKYYGSYILWPPMNVASLVNEHLRMARFDIQDFHLHTVCEYFEIPVDYTRRHSATYDAELTMQIYDFIKERSER